MANHEWLDDRLDDIVLTLHIPTAQLISMPSKPPIPIPSPPISSPLSNMRDDDQGESENDSECDVSAQDSPPTKQCCACHQAPVWINEQPERVTHPIHTHVPQSWPILVPWSFSLVSLNSFAKNLAGFDMMVNSDTPSIWLAKCNSQIRDILPRMTIFEDEDTMEAELFVGSSRSIYQRFILYTMAHIKHCKDMHQRLLDNLRAHLRLWNTWDDVTLLLNHHTIHGYLWACLRALEREPADHHCDTGDCLHRLLELDITAILVKLSSHLSHDDRYASLLSLRGRDAQTLLNLLQASLDFSYVGPQLKQVFLRALLKLSKRSALYPECLVLQKMSWIEPNPTEAGRFGDVYRGEIHDKVIAMKVVRLYRRSNLQELAKDFSREAVTWAQLSHPNILPFYGIYHWDTDHSRLCFVSPWMTNGTIVEFLKVTPNADRVSLLLDIACGLDYLHTDPQIIHGDLKGVNVLVTPSHTACLADFGLAAAAESKFLRWSTSTVQGGGTLRWQGPELLAPESDHANHNTTASDIYALACVGYEIFSGLIPFRSITKDIHVVTNVIAGKRPLRPTPSEMAAIGVPAQHMLDDTIWSVIEACWGKNPGDRPTANDVVHYLQSGPARNAGERPQNQWDQSFVAHLRSNLIDHPFCRPQEDFHVPVRVLTPSSTDSSDSDY